MQSKKYELRQVDWSILLYKEAEGDKNLFISMYAGLDEAGEIPRESNVHPLGSREYALIMWHTGKKLGWFR